MEWGCAYAKQIEGWVVEAIGADGEVYVAQFFGPLAEERAKEYADWKNATQELPDRSASRMSGASHESGRYATHQREPGRL